MVGTLNLWMEPLLGSCSAWRPYSLVVFKIFVVTKGLCHRLITKRLCPKVVEQPISVFQEASVICKRTEVNLVEPSKFSGGSDFI
jgi:hypothetical protein